MSVEYHQRRHTPGPAVLLDHPHTLAHEHRIEDLINIPRLDLTQHLQRTDLLQEFTVCILIAGLAVAYRVGARSSFLAASSALICISQASSNALALTAFSATISVWRRSILACWYRNTASIVPAIDAAGDTLQCEMCGHYKIKDHTNDSPSNSTLQDCKTVEPCEMHFWRPCDSNTPPRPRDLGC